MKNRKCIFFCHASYRINVEMLPPRGQTVLHLLFKVDGSRRRDLIHGHKSDFGELQSLQVATNSS